MKINDGMHIGVGVSTPSYLNLGGLFKAIPFILCTNRDHLVLKFKRALRESVSLANSLSECQH